MRTFDLSPLFRSTVGFDRVSRLLDAALQSEENGYPPYNIEKLGEDRYRITMAVAGFTEDDVEIVSKEGVLNVKGRGQKEDQETTYLHRGIAGRAFERRFQLADHIEVTGATLAHGLLHIELVREVPEAMKPRVIQIASGATPAQVEGRQAA